MQPRVTAILVARNGSEFLEHTLAALGSQTRPPNAVVFVDSGSTDSSLALLVAGEPTQLVTESAKRSFGAAVAHGLQVAPPASSDNDWIWLLSHDSAPHPRALATLLGAVEIAPSVAIAGPKLMRWDRPDTIAEYGETLTRFGSSVALVEDELDQAQHDTGSDLLGVAAAGMLVRRSVWSELGGFDPALPSIDASLDFSVRARLSGHRVVGVPSARVLTAGGPELFGRATMSATARAKIRRAAQLHRRLVYSHRWALPLHWLSLLPLALLRSIGLLIQKHPASIGGEFSTAVRAAIGSSVGDARRNLRRTRKVGWGAIAPLRISVGDARELRAQQWETAATAVKLTPRTRVGFFSGGGAWAVLVAAVVGVIAFSPFLGASALAGGALAPLSATIGELWGNVGYGWHDAGGGFSGASDPFTTVLALLGSLTWWAPSASIVVLYFAALPLAALGAWWCAVRLTERSWPPVVAALLWALAPPFLSSMSNGHLGAVLVHLLLPWFVIAVLAAGRSWSAGGAAALLFAAITASAPVLAPALVVGLVAWMIVHPRRIPHLFGVFIPAAALFLPLIVDQVRRGNPLALLADPGIPVLATTPSGWHLAIGVPDQSLNGWEGVGSIFGLADVAGPLLAAGLLAPFALLALLSLFLPGSRRAVPALALALLGFATAVLSTRLELSISGSEVASIWPGAGLSLFWIGLTGAVVVALDSLGRSVLVPALVVAIASTLVAGPLLAAPLSKSSAVIAGPVATLPAFVSAEAGTDARLGTLQLDPQADGGIAVTLHRGSGTTLDEWYTLDTTAQTATTQQKRIATLAGNLASSSGLDIAGELDDAHIGFVLLPGAEAGTEAAAESAAAGAAESNAEGAPAADAAAAAAAEQAKAATTARLVADALDANRVFAPVGDTEIGRLWHYEDVSASPPPVGLSATQSPIGWAILLVQAFIFFVTLLLAVPSARGRVRSTVTDNNDETPGFDEDDNV